MHLAPIAAVSVVGCASPMVPRAASLRSCERTSAQRSAGINDHRAGTGWRSRKSSGFEGNLGPICGRSVPCHSLSVDASDRTPLERRCVRVARLSADTRLPVCLRAPVGTSAAAVSAGGRCSREPRSIFGLAAGAVALWLWSLLSLSRGICLQGRGECRVVQRPPSCVRARAHACARLVAQCRARAHFHRQAADLLTWLVGMRVGVISSIRLSCYPNGSARRQWARISGWGRGVATRAPSVRSCG
jgi:hypothetical protein